MKCARERTCLRRREYGRVAAGSCSIFRGHSSAGRASRWQREGQEFESPCLHHGDVAQLVERLLCKQDVAGSIPVVSTI